MGQRVITLNEKVIKTIQNYRQKYKVKRLTDKKQQNEFHFVGLIRMIPDVDYTEYEIVEMLSINNVEFIKSYIRAYYDKFMVRYYDFRTINDILDGKKEEVIEISHIIFFKDEDLKKIKNGKIPLDSKIPVKLTYNDINYNLKRFKHHLKSGRLEEEKYIEKIKSLHDIF